MPENAQPAGQIDNSVAQMLKVIKQMNATVGDKIDGLGARVATAGQANREGFANLGQKIDELGTKYDATAAFQAQGKAIRKTIRRTGGALAIAGLALGVPALLGAFNCEDAAPIYENKAEEEAEYPAALRPMPVSIKTGPNMREARGEGGSLYVCRGAEYFTSDSDYSRLQELLDEETGRINSDLLSELPISLVWKNGNDRLGRMDSRMYDNVYKTINTDRQDIPTAEHCWARSQNLSTAEVDAFIAGYEALRTGIAQHRTNGGQLSIGDILTLGLDRREATSGALGDISALRHFMQEHAKGTDVQAILTAIQEHYTN